MSNSFSFSRIFNLQSFNWFCFNYSFWLFLRCIWKKKIITRARKFYNHWIWKFSKFQILSFPFLILLILKLQQTHSYIHYLKIFLKPIFSKVITGGKGVYFLKILVNFFGFIYPLTWGVGYIIWATFLLLILPTNSFLEINNLCLSWLNSMINNKIILLN